MMSNFIKIYSRLVIIAMIAGFSSCKKFVDISPPSTQVVTASVFNNDASATAVQTGIYTQMQSSSESFNMAIQSGLLADELTNYSTSTKFVEFYNNAMQAKDISAPWANAYTYIYRANSVIGGLESYNGVTAGARQQLIGEALFIRAFWHFYLANCYGDVPLVTTTNYSSISTMARTSKNQVFRQIIADLNEAENLLNSHYIDATDTTTTIDRVRPTKWAAAALLARAYLYIGSYDSAEVQSSLVIANSSLYTLCNSLNSVFLTNSTEAIWQLPPVMPTSNYATPDGKFFILVAAPGTGTINCATISAQLMNSFEMGDQRKVAWIGSFKAGNNTYYFPYKYKVYSTSSAPTEYTMVLRLAEQYLIRAEAELRLGNPTGAVQDLNLIRKRAGLSNYSGPTDDASLSAAILHERQVELFAEWGHRWFDLNRVNVIGGIMGAVTPVKTAGTVMWNASDALYPIPLSEMNADAGLIQNPGYN